ncbi:hypothetical protein D3C81_190800 [compost metagenome]
MDKLIHLSHIVKRTYVEIDVDGRNEILLAIKTMMRKPLVAFNQAYGDFIGAIGKSSDMFDMWLSIQMRVITNLGEHQLAWTQLATMVQEVFNTTEGGEISDIEDEEDWKRRSFLTALAFRIYLNDFLLLSPEDQQKEVKAQEAANEQAA